VTLADVSQYERGRLDRVGDHAVVVGGSMAGLCAARVLADGFERVTVLDRDPFPEVPTTRDGAPQTSHPHVMLEAGRLTLTDFFPGFDEDLFEAGGLCVDAGIDMQFYDRGGFLAEPPREMPMYCATRPLFEHVVREQMRALDGVDLQGGTQVTGYQFDEGDAAVTGVQCRTDGTERTLATDLVVDATGRISRTPRWLGERGYPTPDIEEVHVDVTYSTIRVERPPDDRRAFFAPPDAPRTRGGAVLPVEGGRWEVIVQGVHGDDAPADREGFLEFAESLPVPEIGRLAREQPWTSEGVHHYPFPCSRRRRYERLDRFPEGLVVTGDAVASFNPIYGQGMSVAALDALSLHHTLAEGGLANVGPRFFDRVGEIVDVVWKLAVGRDFEFRQTEGPKPFGTDLFNRYVARLSRKAHSDGVLTEAFARVFRLERPPTTLLRPGIVLRVLAPVYP